MKHKSLFVVKKIFIYTFFFLLFFISGFYIYYLHHYPEPPGYDDLLKYYPEEFLLKFGDTLQLPNTRIQHFINFPSQKKKGTIRIGAFGDSNTFGDEVNKRESYPYQLQQLFNKQFPNATVEVLNFGMSGMGFQEQFFLWEKYSRNYNLDYILLGPKGFDPKRDLTFRINWNFPYFSYPRERFILLRGNRLKRMSIKGKTPEERYKNYYKFIPTWIALRYDKKPLQIWERFFPFLRYNIRNPFYYTKMSDTEESSRVNILLLKKINKNHNKKILFLTNSNWVFNNYRQLEKIYNLNYFRVKGADRFYRVFTHKSSLGNENIAHVYFNALIGRAKFSLKIINCYFKKIDFVGKKSIENLHKVRSVDIVDDRQRGVSLASLRHNSVVHHYNKGSYFNYRVKGTKSFIGFSNTTDFLDFPFFSVAIPLTEGMEISIQLSNKKRVPLGEIRALDQFAKFFVFYKDFTMKREQKTHYESWFLLEKIPSVLRKQIKATGSLKLLVGDYQLGTLYFDNLDKKKSLRFVPVSGYEKSFLMMGSSHPVKEKDFPSEFSVYIQYIMDDSKSFKSLIPDWQCKKETKQVYLNLPHFNPLSLK